MNLSIIIPTYNREYILQESLEKIIELYPDEDYEICVVNDSDIDLTISNKFHDNRIRFFKNRGKGAASARNHGVQHSTYENLLFLDDDIVITPRHFEKHLESLNRYPNAIVMANRREREDLVKLLSESAFGRYKANYDYIWYKGTEVIEINDRYAYIAGGATFSCSMNKVLFLQLKGFDETFPYAGSEDYDLFERAKKSGFRMIFDRENWCYHNEPFNNDLDVWLMRHYRGVASFILLCNKHPEKKITDRFQLYQKLRWSDGPYRQAFKIKAIVLSSSLGSKLITFLIAIGEKISWSDSIMRRLYNAKFVESIKKGFKHFAHLQE